MQFNGTTRKAHTKRLRGLTTKRFGMDETAASSQRRQNTHTKHSKRILHVTKIYTPLKAFHTHATDCATTKECPVTASKASNIMHLAKQKPLRPVHVCGAYRQTKRKSLERGRPRLKSQSFWNCRLWLDRARSSGTRSFPDSRPSHKLGCTHYEDAVSPCPNLCIAAAFLRSPV